jgi:hypothetical protein
MYRILFFLTLILIVSCKSDPKPPKLVKSDDSDTTNMVGLDSLDTVPLISDYKLTDVDPKLRAEFRKSLVKIEAEHGIQWDFCTCIVKNDSLNKALQKPNLPDKQFDILLTRSDTIEQRCQAFLAQNVDITPDQRALHEKKVRDCLRAAGLK